MPYYSILYLSAWVRSNEFKCTHVLILTSRMHSAKLVTLWDSQVFHPKRFFFFVFFSVKMFYIVQFSLNTIPHTREVKPENVNIFTSSLCVLKFSILRYSLNSNHAFRRWRLTPDCDSFHLVLPRTESRACPLQRISFSDTHIRNLGCTDFKQWSSRQGL